MGFPSPCFLRDPRGVKHTPQQYTPTHRQGCKAIYSTCSWWHLGRASNMTLMLYCIVHHLMKCLWTTTGWIIYHTVTHGAQRMMQWPSWCWFPHIFLQGPSMRVRFGLWCNMNRCHSAAVVSTVCRPRQEHLRFKSPGYLHNNKNKTCTLVFGLATLNWPKMQLCQCCLSRYVSPVTDWRPVHPHTVSNGIASSCPMTTHW